MSSAIELVSMGAFLLVFLGTWALIYFVFWRPRGDDARAIARLRGLASDESTADRPAGLSGWAGTALPRLGELALPRREEHVARLKARLALAGLYHPSTAKIFFGAKLALMGVFSILCGLIPLLCGLVSLPWAMMLSTAASAAGLAAPNAWLAWCIGRRQRELLRAVPDFLDMLVLCLEGGLSLTAALPRVIGEIVQVHPILGEELAITQQTASLGLSVGDALKQLGDRCGLAELKDLASVVLQSERFGASLVKTLRTHADAYRVERQQRAEESAHKASVKILFPMLLFIFPAVFVVLLGPAAFQIAAMFAR